MENKTNIECKFQTNSFRVERWTQAHKRLEVHKYKYRA